MELRAFVDIVFCVIIYQTDAFSLGCPEPLERYIRSKALCKDSNNYTCLFDENSNSYIESCSIKSDFQRPGYRVTLRTNLHADACPDKLYQPFIFFTNKSSNCELQRSFCREEGQVVSNNGTVRTDKQCRCNYANGYTYVTKPGNICSCVPSVEDCSCYRKKCSNNRSLSPDYKCIDNFSWSGKFLCSSSSDLRTPTVSSNEIYTKDDNKRDVRRDKIGSQISIMAIVAVLWAFIIFVKCQDDIHEDLCLEKEESVVEPNVIKMVKEKITSTRCIVLWGNPGCGKTTKLHNIAIYLERQLGYKLIHCNKPFEIFKEHSVSVRHAFVIDDICGKFVFSFEKFLKWKRREKHIETLLQDDKVILLMACSSAAFTTDSVKQFRLFADNAFEITRDIVSQNDQNTSCTYAEIIKRKITDLQLSNTSAFHCLFMLILKQGCIDEAVFTSHDDRKYIKISSNMCSKLGIAISRRSCLTSLKLLYNNFIVKKNDSFSIKQYSIYEHAVVFFGKELQECFIQCADPEIITQHFCVTTCNNHDRNGLFSVQVNKENEELYFQRIKEQLLRRNLSEVFSIQEMRLPEYRKRLVDYLKQHNQDVKQISDSICRIEGVSLSTLIRHYVNLRALFYKQ